MNAQQFKEKLIQLNACDKAIKWADGKDWPTVYATCERGDWLMWLFVRTNPDDKRLHNFVAVRQANARDAAWDAACAAACAAAWDAAMDAACAVWDAAWDAACAAACAAARDAAMDAACAVWDAAWDAAFSVNLKQTADIFRKYVPIEAINI